MSGQNARPVSNIKDKWARKYTWQFQLLVEDHGFETSREPQEYDRGVDVYLRPEGVATEHGPTVTGPEVAFSLKTAKRLASGRYVASIPWKSLNHLCDRGCLTFVGGRTRATSGFYAVEARTARVEAKQRKAKGKDWVQVTLDRRITPKFLKRLRERLLGAAPMVAVVAHTLGSAKASGPTSLLAAYVDLGDRLMRGARASTRKVLRHLDRLLDAQDYSRAASEARRAIRKLERAPNSLTQIWRVRTRLGKALLMLKQTSSALEQFREARRESKDDYRAICNLALICAETGMHSEAAVVLADIPPKFSGTVVALNARGVVADRAQQHELATRMFTAASEKRACGTHVYVNLASSLARQGNFSEAVRAVRAGLRRRPRKPRDRAILHWCLADILLEETIIKMGGRRVSIDDESCMYEFSTVGDRPSVGPEVIVAAKHAERALAIAGDDMAAIRLHLGLAYSLADRFEDAIAAAEPILSSERHRVFALNIVANSHYYLGQYKRAIAEFERLSRLDPSTPRYLAALGHCFRLDDRMPVALEWYQRAAEHVASETADIRHFAQASLVLGREAQLVVWLVGHAVSRADFDAIVEIMSNLGRSENATRLRTWAVEAWLTRHATSSAARASRRLAAKLHMKQGQWDEAIAHLRAIPELEKTSQDWALMATAHQRGNEWSEAVAAANRAGALTSSDADRRNVALLQEACRRRERVTVEIDGVIVFGPVVQGPAPLTIHLGT